MFGTSAPTLPCLTDQNLQCKQEHTIEKYIGLHEEKNRNHKMDCKLSWIESALEMVEREDLDAPTLDCIEAFTNKLDAEHVQIERFSETNCRKKKDGKFPYFPEMNQWWQNVVYTTDYSSTSAVMELNQRASDKSTGDTKSPNRLR